MSDDTQLGILDATATVHDSLPTGAAAQPMHVRSLKNAQDPERMEGCRGWVSGRLMYARISSFRDDYSTRMPELLKVLGKDGIGFGDTTCNTY